MPHTHTRTHTHTHTHTIKETELVNLKLVEFLIFYRLPHRKNPHHLIKVIKVIKFIILRYHHLNKLLAYYQNQ